MENFSVIQRLNKTNLEMKKDLKAFIRFHRIFLVKFIAGVTFILICLFSCTSVDTFSYVSFPGLTTWSKVEEREVIEDYFSFNESLYELEVQKTILLWNVPYNKFSMVLEFTPEQLSVIDNETFHLNSAACGHCIVSRNRKKIVNSSAVLFHPIEFTLLDIPLEETRHPDQYYVWWFQESPSEHNYQSETGYISNFFNMTMNVRRSSDIYSPYGSLSYVLRMIWSIKQGIDLVLEKGVAEEVVFTNAMEMDSIMKETLSSAFATKYFHIPNSIPVEIHDLLRSKDRMAVWVSSNCVAIQRLQYYSALRDADLRIDLFGDCGLAFPIQSRSDPAFYKFLSRYKFYLAFENSYHCKDYITEKFWYNSLYSGAVPIIFGPHKDDVAAVLPPKTYIHVEDFSNPLELVKYLEYLDTNLTAYAEYLEWRSWVRYLDKNGEYHASKFQKRKNTLKKIPEKLVKTLDKFAVSSVSGFCELCRKIHAKNQPRKIVSNPMTWHRYDRAECLYDNLAARMIGV